MNQLTFAHWPFKTKLYSILFMLVALFILTSCSPVKTPETNQYALELFGTSPVEKTKSNISILVSPPEAMAGTQTEQMHYIERPYELGTFVHNVWTSPPANMLYPLITQSLQKTGYFSAVASGPYTDKADYRLDTQLISLQQNFISKPSVLELTIKAMLVYVPDTRVVGSIVLQERVRCPTDTPYGGVIAANTAVQSITKRLSTFVIKTIQHKTKQYATSDSKKLQISVQ